MNYNEMKSTPLVCDYCGSEDGANRPIGNYIVELKETTIDGETRLACQGCRVKYRVTKQQRSKKLEASISEMGWIRKAKALLANH